MTLTKAFYDAVEDKDIRKIRIMMEDSLLIDPTFVQFNEMENTVKGLKNLYDVHDGKELRMFKSTWDEDYMNDLMVEVVMNFSHERINHLKEVVQYLYPKTEQKEDLKKDFRLEKTLTYQEQKRKDQLDGNYRGAKITVGVVAGAVVGGVIASAAGVTVVGGATVGAVVGGGAVYVATKGSNEE